MNGSRVAYESYSRLTLPGNPIVWLSLFDIGREYWFRSRILECKVSFSFPSAHHFCFRMQLKLLKMLATINCWSEKSLFIETPSERMEGDLTIRPDSS